MSNQMFYDLIDAAEAYYGAGDPSYIALISHSYTPDEYASILRQIPGVDVTLDSNGVVRSWLYKSPYEFTNAAADAAQAVNSNVQSGTASAGNTAYLSTPITSKLDNDGKVELGQGGTQYSGGTMAGAALTIIGGVQASVAAAATGFALGKTISSTLYDTFPDFFDSHEMEYFNPEKWGDMADIWEDATGSSLVGDAIRLLYGVNENTGEATAYLREDQLEFFAAYLANMGVFNDNSYDYTGVQYYSSKPSFSTLQSTGTSVNLLGFSNWHVGSNVQTQMMFSFYANFSGHYMLGFLGSRYNGEVYIETSYGSVSEYIFYTTVQDSNRRNYYTVRTVWHLAGAPDSRMLDIGVYTGADNSNQLQNWFIERFATIDIAGIIGTSGTTGGIDGIGDQPNANIPNINSDTPYTNIMPQILQDVPYLNDNRIELPYVDENGNEQTIIYYPVPMPTGGEGNQPTGENIDQSNPFISPDSSPQVATFINSSIQPDPVTVTDTLPDTLNPTDNPPDTGSGDSPTVVLPTGNATRLWSVYNPSQAQVDSFGAWLWSSNFIDQIKKLFTDPMSAIIGIHKVFATPAISGQGTIVCGYIDSQVPSNLVSYQYTTIDCGTVNLYEYFGNIFDYIDTQVSIYLPFIGIHPLETSFVMRASINVLYHVDVYTGACLAEIKVTRDGYSPVIYTFSGDCSVRYPLSSGSYMGIVSGILTAGAAVMSGGGLGLISGALSLGHSQTSIQKSGSLQGNTGAMGCKKPYLIISRPQTVNTEFAHFTGYGANTKTTVSTMNGYFRMTDVDVIGVVGATGNEIQRIKTLLESGVHVTG